MKTLIVVLGIILVCSFATAETYQYDVAGRLVLVKYDNGLETRYTYDKNGNMVKAKTDVTNSVQADDQSRKLEVQPLPAKDKLSVCGLPDGQVHVTLTTLAGATVLDITQQTQAGTIELNVQELAAGTYAVKATHGSTVYTTTVVIY